MNSSRQYSNQIQGGAAVSSIYFMEDDYCMIEILPLENLAFCLKQAEESRKFADAHRSGIGSTGVYVISDGPVGLREKRITASSLDKAMQEALPKFDEVYYEAEHSSPQTFAYGYDSNVALFFEEKDEIVDTIWLTLVIKKEQDVDRALRMLDALSGLGAFLLADWGWCVIERLENRDSLKPYLRKRLKVFAARRQ